MAAHTTSIRVDIRLVDEAKKHLGVKFRTEAATMALREIVASKHFKKIAEEKRREPRVRRSPPVALTI